MKEEKHLVLYGQTDEPTDNSRAYQKSEKDSISVSPPEHFKSETKSLAQNMREEKQNDTTTTPTTATEHYSTVLYCTLLTHSTVLYCSIVFLTPWYTCTSNLVRIRGVVSA